MFSPKPAKPSTFLKRHPKLVANLVRDAFSDSTDKGVNGKIIHFAYCPDDCSDFSNVGLPVKGQKYGPGYQLIVQYGTKHRHCLFYAERECKTLKAFLNILNTDAGMAQLIYGDAYRSLNINYYDYNNNLIQFTLNDDVTVRKAALSACWNVKNSTFNVKEFITLRQEAAFEAGLPLTEGEKKFSRDRIELHHVDALKYQTPDEPARPRLKK